MGFRVAIDALKGVPYPQQVDPDTILGDMKEATSSEEFAQMEKRLQPLKGQHPLRALGLEQPVNYAFQARAAFEISQIAEQMGEAIREAYNLHPAGQDGIGLDWQKLGERLWVPANYKEAISIEEEARAVLSYDEGNCYRRHKLHVDNPDEAFVRFSKEVIRIAPEEKIRKLTRDSVWRALVRDYAQALITDVIPLKYRKYVAEGFSPIFDSMISAYREEMERVLAS